ncbi:DEAD/DEAH box helicase [Photobacterium angustum]|uniref:Diguanylate cyclase n=1 Tax=Photobacterium angustum TaxID=661 RepID=A0A2S7W2L9_PHOAN|nr:DEAD/DEAH box helicase family protein [Photobacterium angustum]PQJ68233.1 diguanylate cyclase [Photobacterium angustum]
MLRQWQQECVALALKKFTEGNSHFFCQATPGAGKTVFAASVALELLKKDMIDLVLCFSPSLTIAESIKRTFSRILNCSFYGGLGSIGQSITYQSIPYLKDDFWKTLQNHRVLVVFDEIHHCAGSDIGVANVWGEQILAKVQHLAIYTLAMSGTPWRSDMLPIVMSEYKGSNGQLFVDYQYTLAKAIEDRVCRSPKIVLVDNESLSVTSENKTESFSSILQMLKETKTSYQSVIQNDEAMEYLLGLGCQKLADIRLESPQAGGLVVASSVQHAISIKRILLERYAQTVTVVTYRHDEPLAEIERYRQGNTQWIVSVGMISEGTDIPRLQVCCHISSVKTELYFRQVLGRILRVNEGINQQAWLFTFAEESLITFSERIEQDIPESCMFQKMTNTEILHTKSQRIGLDEIIEVENLGVDGSTNLVWNNKVDGSSYDYPNVIIDELLLGTFKQRVISAFLKI